jgi:hypothetical protein
LREQREHRQRLSDGTVLYIILLPRPFGWVSRFGVDGSATADEESPFLGSGAEESSLIEGEELADRATVPTRNLDLLGYHVTGGVHGQGEPLGIAVAGRAPPGVRCLYVEGVEQAFPVDQATGLFCAARTWRAAPRRATLRIRADDPAVAPQELTEDPTECSYTPPGGPPPAEARPRL